MRSAQIALVSFAFLVTASLASANVFSFQQVTSFDLDNLSPGDVVIFDIMYVQDTALTSLGFGVLSTDPNVGALTSGAQNVGGWFFPPSGPFVNPAGTITIAPDDVRQYAWFNLDPWPANGINTTMTTDGEPAGRLGFVEVTAGDNGTTTIQTYIGPDDGVNDDTFNPVNPTLAEVTLTVPEPGASMLGATAIGVIALIRQRRRS